MIEGDDAPPGTAGSAPTDAPRTVPAINNDEITPSGDVVTAAPFDELLGVLEYTTAPTASLYVAVMEAALDARDRFRLRVLEPARLPPAPGAAVLSVVPDHTSLSPWTGFAVSWPTRPSHSSPAGCSSHGTMRELELHDPNAADLRA